MYDFLVHLVNPFLSLINGRPIIKNKENLPKGNYIIVAPHRTWMDPVLLALAIYPEKFSFMAKKELFRGRFANWFLRKVNAFPVDRLHPGPSAVKIPVKQLRKTDLSTIIFPTGSRYSAQLKGGALVIAQLAGVPLVPAVYQGPLSFPKMFSHHNKRKIAFGKPIVVDRKKRLTEDVIKDYEQQMQTAFDNLDHQLDPHFRYKMPDKPANDHF